MLFFMASILLANPEREEEAPMAVSAKLGGNSELIGGIGKRKGRKGTLQMAFGPSAECLPADLAIGVGANFGLNKFAKPEKMPMRGIGTTKSGRK
jgi:hypothetical protein